MAYHKLTVLGKLVGDPRVTSFANGGKVAKFGLPINFTRPKKNPETGQWEGESFIIDVDCFNSQFDKGRQLADVVAQHLKKGSQVYVEGRLKMNEFTDRNGTKQAKPVLVADVLEILEWNNAGGTQQGAAQPPSARKVSEGASYDDAQQAPIDDIPF
jgi:single-strand DNA-binding protein